MRTRQLLLLLAVVAALVLTGCGDSADPASPPRASPTSTSSPSVSAAPSLPPAAAAHTKAGAIAFVRHYIALFNRAQTSGDTSEMKSLAKPTCVSCRSVVSAIRRVYDHGGRAEGGNLTIQGAQAVPSTHGQTEVDITGKFGRSLIFEQGKSTPRVTKGGSVVATFYVRYTDRWVIARWVRVS